VKMTRLLLALALVPGLLLPAADPAAVAAALKQPADAATYPQAGAVVLLDETVETLDSLGRTTTEGHILIKILQDRALRQLSDQKIPFRGDTHRCQVLVARTHLPSGAVREPEADGLMEVSDPEAAAAPFYSNARLKVISFPGVQIGAVIELKYRVEPLPGAKAGFEPEPFTGETLFGDSEPILQKSLTLRVPQDVDLKCQMFNGAPAPAVRTSPAGAEYAWVVRDQRQIVSETGMVPLEELVPRVVWTLAKDRQQLGLWLYQRFHAAARPDPAVTAKARELTASLASPEAKLERLALFVTKEIQNVPLGLGRVGYQPTPAATILANRYADGRDKFVLFDAMVAAIGLPAEPIYVQERRTRMSELACLNDYQDILARVSLPAGPRFYNLSENQCRLGQLTPLDSGRPGLLVTAAGGQAITTPEADLRTQSVHARWDMALDAKGDLAGRITLEYGGLFDHQLRSRLFGRNEQDRRVLFQAAADQVKKGARMEGFQVSDLLDLTKAPVVTLDLRIPQFGCLQGDMMILNLPGDLFPMAETPVQPGLPSMQHPFLVPGTFGMVAELSLKVPEGYRIAYQPATQATKEGPFTFQIASAPSAGGLTLRRSIAWKDAVVPPEAYPALWRAYGRTTVPGNALVLLAQN